MSAVTRIQILRGTTTQRLAFIPLKGELVQDTDTKVLYIGDGVTAGGVLAAPLATQTENLVSLVKNITGVTIPLFKVVYINGAQGNTPTVALAQANSEATSSKSFGVTQANIADNTSSFVIVEGKLLNVNTSAFNVGDALWLSPTVAGGVTNVKPVAPNHMVFIGIVVKAHSSQGIVEVRIQNGFELDELHDVLITSKDDRDFLMFDEASGLWKNTKANKTDVGLDQVDNTSDVNKPVSTAQASAIAVVQADVDAHEARTDNPHATTKAQVGLGNVDNTSDVNKPVSTAQAAAIAIVQADVDAHEARTDNPHNVTKAQVGLSNVDNTSDVNKPVSTAQAAAIASAQSGAQSYTDAQIAALINASPALLDTLDELAAALGDDPNFAATMSTALSNRLRVDTASQGLNSTQKTNAKTNIDLQNVDNTSDANKPVSTAQAAAIAIVQADVDAHEARTDNPHATTKAQVGLSNVDNTSDVNKPISTATQTALNAKYDASNPNGYETPAQLNARDTANRNRSNHTGTQTASTISDFVSAVAAQVLSTVVTGISFATSSAVVATDTILQALGKLQAQITTLFNRTIATGYGLTGGGNLTADRTLAVSLFKDEVFATNTITTTSATDVLMTGMTLTPTAGTYLVLFKASLSGGNDDSSITASIYAANTLQSGSESPVVANVSGGLSNPNTTTQNAVCFSVVTVNGSETIEGRWRRAAGTATATNRHLKIIRIG